MMLSKDIAVNLHPFPRSLGLICLLTAPAVLAAQSVASGAGLQVRLSTKTGSLAPAGERVEAVVVTPVADGESIVIPAGSGLIGCVTAATPSKPEQRALLELEFFELALPDGRHMPFAARVTEVDNARETVDKEGRITGILESETLTARMDQGLDKLANRFAKFAGILQAAKQAVLKKADPEITYGPGVELQLETTRALDVPGDFSAAVAPVEPADALERLVDTLPFQTTAEKPPKPSDLTNLMYIGTREQVEQAFSEAGWFKAETLNATSGLETVRAVVEDRGYKEAPMSTLLLEGQKPALVFQKQNNTFAKRHHLRIFERAETFEGRPVWVCAATHDIGIEFSPENRTFIHKIDSEIDRERAKVVADLLLTGRVQGLALVDRPDVPAESGNATGDKIFTDGRMAVLRLR